MATTRIIPMHFNAGKTLGQCLFERIQYGMNPEKTGNGIYITAYACDPKTVDAEFLLSKRRYEQLTGRSEQSDVIAYQIRQSFKPGEVTPEEANQIGYEFASRFLKGKHAFIVCTHIDKDHIHNHIYWNSTTLDCKRKFRDFHRSAQAVRHLSDLICLEHQLSIIAHPKGRGKSYSQWLGNRAIPSHRQLLRLAIDAALAKKPCNFDELLSFLEAQGYRINRGKQISFRHSDFKKSIRLNSLGNGYTEADLRAVISGQRKHTQQRENAAVAQALIDIQAKLAEGKGEGYRRWATVENLKRMAKTKLYMDEHGLDFFGLEAQMQVAVRQETALSEQIKQAQNRLAALNVLKTHIVNYSKTRAVYAEYQQSGYSKKYYAAHEADILIHKAAKKAFDDLGAKKLPTVKSIQAEFARLLTEKKQAYAELKKLRQEVKQLSIHKANCEALFNFGAPQQEKEPDPL